jgi:hypothetical protein
MSNRNEQNKIGMTKRISFLSGNPTRASEWLVLTVKWANYQLYYGESKLYFSEQTTLY